MHANTIKITRIITKLLLQCREHSLERDKMLVQTVHLNTKRTLDTQKIPKIINK